MELTYLLDTDHASVLERPGDRCYAPLVANLNLHTPDGVGVAVASFHEQLLGAHNQIATAKSPDQLLEGYRQLFQVLDFFRGFPLVPYDEAALARFADLKARKVRIGTMDLRIAATALSRDLTLVTRNRSDFDRVPGLRLADWTT